MRNARGESSVELWMVRFPLGVALVTVLAIAAVTALTWSGSQAVAAPSPKALEAALLAPCCWNGTLATHDSPLASELRGEIETRSDKGETTAAIEADLVTRYGERVRAMPAAGAFSNVMVIALDVLIAAMGALALMLSRWRRNAANDQAAPARRGAAPPERDAYDERIDAELADLETD